MVVWRKGLPCLFAFACLEAHGDESPREDPKLTAFCHDAQSHLRYPALDPGSLPVGARFKAARPTLLLGQRIQESRRRLALEGTVAFGLVINSVGRVAHLMVLETSGEPVLDREAISILKTGVFAPASLEGKAVRACLLIKVTFREVNSNVTETRGIARLASARVQSSSATTGIKLMNRANAAMTAARLMRNFFHPASRSHFLPADTSDSPIRISTNPTMA